MSERIHLKVDYVRCVPNDADLISSELMNGRHSPVLDIDFPARLVPSATPGHFHLYLDGLELDWTTYAPLLEALAKAGVIEPGYCAASLARGASFVRPESKPKGVGPELVAGRSKEAHR